jgi:hypothetical protein
VLRFIWLAAALVHRRAREKGLHGLIQSGPWTLAPRPHQGVNSIVLLLPVEVVRMRKAHTRFVLVMVLAVLTYDFGFMLGVSMAFGGGAGGGTASAGRYRRRSRV